MRTYSPKPTEIQRAWHVIDADGLVLGRLSTEVATLLRGKQKPMFARRLDAGDHVIVGNASKVVLTANKASKKQVIRHTGYPGGIRRRSYDDIMASRPQDAVRHAVKGMLPKGPLGQQMLRKLKVYAGPDHPHAAQMPEVRQVGHARRVAP